MKRKEDTKLGKVKDSCNNSVSNIKTDKVVSSHSNSKYFAAGKSLLKVNLLHELISI
jgi:hypothetical protein